MSLILSEHFVAHCDKYRERGAIHVTISKLIQSGQHTLPSEQVSTHRVEPMEATAFCREKLAELEAARR